MKYILKSLVFVLFSLSSFASSQAILKMTCGIHIQKKAGGENPSVLLAGSEVKASTPKDNNKVLVSTYTGSRFSYTVYAEKNVPSKVAPDILISFNDNKEGIKIWSPQGRNSSGSYTISVSEIKKKEPIYYLKCKTE